MGRTGKAPFESKQKLDLDELDAVSGGADRDWQKEGYAATAEPASWCWSNDQCLVFDVTYDNFYVTCPMAMSTSSRTISASGAALK